MKKLLIFVTCLLVTGMIFFGKTNLTMVETITSPSRTELLKTFISEFEALHPDIAVELISPPYESADQKLSLMLNTNQKVDVLEVRDHTIKQFVNNKKLLNLEEYLKSWNEWSDMVNLTHEAASYVDNTPYFIPYGFFVKALFYRKDMLDEMGIEVPKTMEELYLAAKKFTESKSNQYGFDWRGPGEIGFTDTWMMSYVPDIDPKYGYLTTDGKVYFESPEALAAFKDWIKLFKDACPPDSISWGWSEQVNGFVSGLTPFLWQDPDTVPICVERLGSEGKFAVAPLPIGPSGKTFQQYGFAGWGVASYSEHPKEAWELVKFLSTKDINIRFSKSNGTLPIGNSAWEDEFFNQGYYLGWKAMFDDPEHYVFIKIPFDKKEWGPYLTKHRDDLQKVILGRMTPEEALNRWAETWKNAF